MHSPSQCGPPGGFRRQAFTLIEIVVALTIIAVLAAVAIPVLTGLDRDERARAPAQALAEMVQEVRRRALQERRPWQIVFERGGIHACQVSFPFNKREDFLKYLEELRTPPPVTEIERETTIQAAAERQPVMNASQKSLPQPGAVTPPKAETGSVNTAKATTSGNRARPELPWTQTIELQEGMECEVLLWGDGEWDRMDGDKLRCWVFQPSGMASPARVLLRTETLEMESAFDALTGEIRASLTRPATALKP